ncbi:PAAR domain-containing protein [Vogesella sp. LIG4]|uniref:PAAR domain-containing protein n=1 Tax=Vogesella sp. LIG4 TaxID=1192162 RepID=UPI000820075E|nr:PAAR domain-containing protein [Vogesella sp. LIG4]SCK30751.1 Zn-binding Pro-Ala-Ala-Arg (PAAR) domain-containing protein, incolved in TypeVI secretion [Vogesella sp. LIG4]
MTKRAIIRLGDPTTHGGVLLEAFSSLHVYGKPASGIGHKGYCPLCKQAFVIVAAAENVSYFGKNVAVEGMHTSCGAVLIATQLQATIDIVPDAKTASTHAMAPEVFRSEARAGLLYGHRFLIVDSESRKPLANRRYTVMHADGRETAGVTDKAGYTESITSACEEEISIQVAFLAPGTVFHGRELP